MKTLTVRLPDELVAQIEAASRAQGRSKSDVVRERLRIAGEQTRGSHAMLDSIRDLIGSVDGLPPDLGSRYKEYLRAGFGRKRRR
ncbi:MAG TPA: ribbon-helix-helix protein, CopG family [Thermoanaerobaculia bacterium]|jgi:Arc/MetJ-type ribon-helix-helix transcriptional regulator|nr:ribbon-helix-helix protein, CopG family [Thermoanaerobaculia bacterium]